MRKIGKYEVTGMLGRGGMATVYKVRVPVTGKIVALKLLTPHPSLVDLLGAGEVERRFTAEAVTMAGLRHPNIVDVWDYDLDDRGRPFFIMEYYCNNLGAVIGETYRVEDHSRILGLDKAINYIRQSLKGISRLHEEGIVHRDIKPFNILLTDDDVVKISDFGLSKVRGEVEAGPDNLRVGSPYYTAPEQERDPNLATAAADLYSVGIMLYRMLTGALPINEPVNPSRINTHLDKDWDRFIHKAIADDPEDRFPRAREMLDEFEALAQSWADKKEMFCRGDWRSKPAGAPERPERLRHTCLKVGVKAARETFNLDELWRPNRHVINSFRENADGTVFDQATGLIWEKTGSHHPLSWDKAHEYIQRLNLTSFAGLNRWRLPTVDELVSILKPDSNIEDFCLPQLFAPDKKWLWSSDRRSYLAAWYVNFDSGYVSWQDFSCFFYARAVCTMKG